VDVGARGSDGEDCGGGEEAGGTASAAAGDGARRDGLGIRCSLPLLNNAYVTIVDCLPFLLCRLYALLV